MLILNQDPYGSQCIFSLFLVMPHIMEKMFLKIYLKQDYSYSCQKQNDKEENNNYTPEGPHPIFKKFGIQLNF